MKHKLLAVILAMLPMLSYAGNTKYEALAHVQDSLMNDDYKAKDAKGYRKHLDELLAEYNKLSTADKDLYKDALVNDYYNLACTYSLVGDKTNAIAVLVKSGYDDYGHMLEDTDLDNLRDEVAFKQFMQKTRTKKSKYLLTLQKDAMYNKGTQKAPDFVYQGADDPNLAALRKAYNLDSIAGGGNEISRMINLMRWVHNTVEHDGNRGIPGGRNAMNLLTVCANGKNTCNCRGLGIILNEVYLAEGFKSRYVTCLPKDTTDQDCHVITVVFSKTLNRWIWMDPTFDAYVMDENGELLGIREVRERLVHNKPLILNPDANWNHKSSRLKEHYLGYYMAKNLYRLECAASSEYYYENWKDGKPKYFIELKPVSYRSWQKDWDNGKRGNYYTSNEETFWKAPK